MEPTQNTMSLSLIDTTVLARTTKIVETHSEEFADYFYEKLRQTQSDFSTAFRNTDLAKQKEMLREGMSQILALSTDTESLRRYLFDLGIRHTSYEVTEQHYPLVKDVLLKSIKHIHQSEWNLEYDQLWQVLITTITEHMLAGCRWLPEAP